VAAVIGYVNDTGKGTSRQEYETALLATARQAGLDIEAIAWDQAHSDSLAERPHLSRLLSSIDPGTTLIVPSITSLADDVLAQELRLRDLRAAGARIISCAPWENDYLNDDATSLTDSFRDAADKAD
jgi:DNA invertase Pin-like site-specific DNA recombinase